MKASQFNWRSYALGAFILFQLVYLPTANAIKLIALRLPESKGELDDDIQLRGQAFGEPLQTMADAVGTAFVRYGELTGQAQGWSLFAPVFGHQAALPMVVVGDEWHIHRPKPEIMRSSFAPTDAGFYLRPPSPNCRLFNYEYRLALLYWTYDFEVDRVNWEKWEKTVSERVRRQNRSMLAYMVWRCDQFYRRNPTKPYPAHVSLRAEVFPNPPLDNPTAVRDRDQSSDHRIASWSSTYPPPPGMHPVRARDWLPIEEPPP